jgi:hypothetical protein
MSYGFTLRLCHQASLIVGGRPGVRTKPQFPEYSGVVMWTLVLQEQTARIHPKWFDSTPMQDYGNAKMIVKARSVLSRNSFSVGCRVTGRILTANYTARNVLPDIVERRHREIG